MTLELWPLLEGFAFAGRIGPDRPALAALYLALGWSQHTTTGQWPETETWAHVLRGVPEHWLIRAHYHLSWLAHDPENTHHFAEFQAALYDGRSDDQLASIAERMSAWRRSI